MAHLNLRDRRIEARIAYVGPEAHVLSTFDRLRSTPTFALAGERALDWRPATKRFRDCDLHVKLVIGERDGADGVVEARPAASVEEDLATLEQTLNDVITGLEAPPPSSPARADAAHPLLTALRQVLEDTVRAHVEELALRLDTKDADDALALNVLKSIEEIDARKDLRTAVLTLTKRLTKIEASLETLNNQLGELVEELKKPKKSWFT